jgi:hypothetical protein
MRWTVLLAGFLALATAVRADGVTIRGRVVDADGKPVAGAEVAPGWLAEGDRMVANRGVKADAEGKFEYAAPRLPFPLMAITPDGRQGAFRGIPDGAAAADVELKVEALVTVRGKIRLEDDAFALGNGIAILVRDGFGFAGCRTRSGDFAIRVPAGEYVLVAQADDAQGAERPFTLSSDLDLGEIAMPLTALARSYGKDAPAVTGVDRSGKAVTLADFRGKWVLLEFWGFW